MATVFGDSEKTGIRRKKEKTSLWSGKKWLQRAVLYRIKFRKIWEAGRGQLRLLRCRISTLEMLSQDA